MGFFVVFGLQNIRTNAGAGVCAGRMGLAAGVQSATAQKLQRYMRDVVGGGRRWSDVCGVSGQRLKKSTLGRVKKGRQTRDKGGGTILTIPFCLGWHREA